MLNKKLKFKYLNINYLFFFNNTLVSQNNWQKKKKLINYS